MSQQLLETEQAIHELLVQLKDLRSATTTIVQARELVDQSARLATKTVDESQTQVREAVALVAKSVEVTQSATESSARLFESVARQTTVISTFATNIEGQITHLESELVSIRGHISGATEIAHKAIRSGRRNAVLVGFVLVLQLLLVGLYIWIYQAWLMQSM